MTTAQKRKILIRIQALEKQISELKDVRLKLATSEFASATMSSGGGSKSYTRADISKIEDAIETLTAELQSNRAMLQEKNATTPKQIMRVWF